MVRAGIHQHIGERILNLVVGSRMVEDLSDNVILPSIYIKKEGDRYRFGWVPGGFWSKDMEMGGLEL